MVEKILPHCKYLRIGGNTLGEPLLSENFDYFFSSIEKNKPREVHLVTNLTLLDEKKAETLVKYVDNLEVSVEGSQTAYSQIRNFSWQKLLENIKLLQKYREKHKDSKLRATLLICTMLSNLESLMGLFDLKDIGVDKLAFREFVAYDKDKQAECLWRNPERVNAYIKKFEKRSKETGMCIDIKFKNNYPDKKPHKIHSRKPGSDKCYFPWSCISIDNTGSISCCCNNSLELGRITTYEEGLFGFWNNNNFIALRKSVNTAEPWPICLECERKAMPEMDNNGQTPS